MGVTDAGHAGGETSMQVKSSMTPTVTAKHRARRKKEITVSDTPPPPSADKEVEKIVQARIKEKIKEKQDKKKKRTKVVMGKTCKHNICTHFPKDLDCDICRRNEPQKAGCESKGVKACDSLPVPVKFGDAGTLDHKIMNEDDASRDRWRQECMCYT